MTKPHKGKIMHAQQVYCGPHGLGYLYAGTFGDHPEFAGKRGHTSYVVKDDCDIPRHATDGYEIETRNSRYTVVPSV